MRWLLAAVLCALPALAHADDSTAPWAQGVSAAQKSAAHELLEKGNALLLEKRFSEALEQYKLAIAKWDHPAIRFNMVRCLIQLGRLPEATENLDHALEFGAGPLEEGVYAEALNYKKLLEAQTGEVEVACTQPGLQITLDGQPLGACPGAHTRKLAVGRHQLVGAKEGFLTKSIDVIVSGGGHDKQDVSLLPLADTARVVHRWPAWIPWVVFGGGLAVVGAGALVEGVASARMSDFDRALVRDCSGAGCGPGRPIPTADAQLESSAHTYGVIGASVIATGAAAAVAGGVMLYMNRGRTVYGDEVHVTPTAGGAAVTFTHSF